MELKESCIAKELVGLDVRGSRSHPFVKCDMDI